MKFKVEIDNNSLVLPEFLTPISGLQLLAEQNALVSDFCAWTVNGVTRDLRFSLFEDAKVEFIAKQNETVYHTIINQTWGLVLATAIKQLYPTSIIAGIWADHKKFYVDVDTALPFKEDNLIVTEAKVKEIVNQNLAIKFLVQASNLSLEHYKNNPYALELLSEYQPSTSKNSYELFNFFWPATSVCLDNMLELKAVKLLSATGAYWNNDAKQKQLQRITGISAQTEEHLVTKLQDLEARKNKDHRAIGKALEIFTFSDKIGKGLPLLLPKGMAIKKILQSYLRAEEYKWDYQEVETPVLGSIELYETSGHYQHYRENMFPEMIRENENFILRPMTCPHHCMIFQMRKRSYRELPLRLSEHSLLYRYEASGALLGLERVRAMELTDAHIFASKDQIKSEVKRCYELISEVLKTLHIEIDYLSLSLRNPNDVEKYFPDHEMWDRAETALADALMELKLPYKEMIGEAAFYGPKLDIQIKTVLEHEITVSTIQLDFLLPKKFGLKFINAEQQEEEPIIIHRGLIGTYERFLAVLLEQTQGILPFWLSPIQVDILLVNNKIIPSEYAYNLLALLKKYRIRAQISADDKLGALIKTSYENKIPLQVIIGDKEATEESVSYRFFGSKETLVASSPQQFVNELLEMNRKQK